MADICESLEYANLTYEITVEGTKTGTGKTESRLFDGGDLDELVKRVKRYVEAMPKGRNVSITGRVKVTNTFALDADLIDQILNLPPEHKPAPAEPLPQRVVIQERIVVPGPPENGLLNSKEAAKLLGLKHQTLDCWRSLGKGPKYIIVGARSVRYWREDLMKWIEEGKQKKRS